MTRRIFSGLAITILLFGVFAGTASAGGWATITADSGNPTKPNEGETFTFGFTVLQHGVEPAGWVNATYVGINATTGERIEAKAVNEGADGHFVATVTLPSAGYWTWQVELSDLIVETSPQPFAVAAADGSVPQMSSAEMLTALDRVRAELRADYEGLMYGEAELLRAEIQGLRTDVVNLRADRAELEATVARLTAAPAATATEGSVPLFAIIGLAVLAGAISGFAMTVLGRGRDASAPAGVLTTR